MCNALTHVGKSHLVLILSDAWPCRLLATFVTSIYYENSLLGVLKCKRLRFISTGIF